LKNLLKYANRLNKTRKQVESAISLLKNQNVINKKTQKKINKLENILSNLKQVLSVLVNTENDIKKTLAVIRQAVKNYSNSH